jgi:hypothetical protein
MLWQGRGCKGRGTYQGKSTFINHPQKEGQEKEKKKRV